MAKMKTLVLNRRKNISVCGTVRKGKRTGGQIILELAWVTNSERMEVG
jgi:hypothetical protein